MKQPFATNPVLEVINQLDTLVGCFIYDNLQNRWAEVKQIVDNRCMIAEITRQGHLVVRNKDNEIAFVYKRHANRFISGERFYPHLEEWKSGDTTASVVVLLPHEPCKYEMV